MKRGKTGMKYREFVYTGGPAAELNVLECKELVTDIQAAILMSLEKRKLLTTFQRECCMDKLFLHNKNNLGNNGNE